MDFNTQRLIIRGPIERDAYDIFRNYTQNRDVTKYLTWIPHSNIDQTKSWIMTCIANANSQTRTDLVIFHKLDQQAIGMISFRLDGHKANFGFVLTKRYRNQGIMTEAMTPIIASLRKLPNIYRIWSVHDIENYASGKVMLKLGLQFEGILRRYIVHPNLSPEPRDVKIYALVK